MKKQIYTTFLALGIIATMTGCGSSGKTIIDEVPYNTDGTMVAEVKEYLDSKDLIYEEKGGIHNTVSDRFLGYRAYYDVDVDDFYIYLTFDTEEELTQASKDVKKYFKSREDNKYKKSDLCKFMEDNANGWSEIFQGDSGITYVLDYDENKDDTFNYKAVLYCTMSDLDEAKEANGYIMGELNTYIAISVKGADNATLEMLVGKTNYSSIETAAAAPTEEAAATNEDDPVIEEPNEETGDIGQIISMMEEVEKNLPEENWEQENEHTDKGYVYLPTTKGYLVYKRANVSPASYGFLIYYENGVVSSVQVAWDRTQINYLPDEEKFVGSEYLSIDECSANEYTIVDGKIQETGKKSISADDYSDTNFFDSATEYKSLEEALL